MRYIEAIKLKKGDLVILDHRNKRYAGLVLEVESIDNDSGNWCGYVTLKQPGFDNGFRIKDCDTRYLQRYEP